ncbi:7-cyano-7-deazaguanine synthase [Streptomonospora sp. S1-112]|uniref:7-cyano-7-deazaguanine synthase n=1 Tax=Streptomonospora mangrovi TaxID=2883123 RepID=A0A9X3NI78_9ACTN|nr:7-cyano-7-deazaguanine synthase [Streptomonospora mangrovi]MDA0564172.1 7-cyano-7-deazaguanine synthase [Streptomonospora mangrovi]
MPASPPRRPADACGGTDSRARREDPVTPREHEKPLAVVVFSGGLDSTVLATHYRATHTLLLLSFDYGQRHRGGELRAAREIAAHLGAEHHVIGMRGLGALLTGCSLTDPSHDVPEALNADAVRAITIPNRNALITDAAAGVAMARGAELVALGVHRVPVGDPYPLPDASPRFFAAYRGMIRVAAGEFPVPRVETPFIGMAKKDIVAHGHALSAPLGRSWTCYLDGPAQCGRCFACLTRRRAFADAGVPDPTAYEKESVHDAPHSSPAQL